MAENALNVEIREGTGKGVARKLRAAGRIPGVCYGKGGQGIAVSLDPTQLRTLLERSESGMNTILSLQGGGSLDGKMVLVRELQREPVRGAYLHADLFAVDVEQTIEVSVPIHVTGKAAGLEQGGIVDQSLRELDLECLPLSIPREIVVDVTALDIGDSIHVRDISLPEGVALRSDPELSIVSVVMPAKEEEVAPEEAAEEVPVEGAEEGAEEKTAEGGEAKATE